MWWILTGLLLACQEEADDSKWKGKGDWKPSIPAVLVKAEPVGTGTVSDTIEITGALESIEQVNIIPETTGVVQSIFVREGDEVSKGTQLVKSSIRLQAQLLSGHRLRWNG